MNVLCRHIRCDMSSIFTLETLALRELPVSRKFYLPVNMCHNHDGVNFVNQKPENGKLRTRANSEHCLLKNTHTPFWLPDTKKKREASGGENDREKRGTGKKDERSINGTHNFHRKVSTGKLDYLFKNSFFSQKISSVTNQNVVFHFQTKRNFRKFFVNGKQPQRWKSNEQVHRKFARKKKYYNKFHNKCSLLHYQEIANQFDIKT